MGLQNWWQRSVRNGNNIDDNFDAAYFRKYKRSSGMFEILELVSSSFVYNFRIFSLTKLSKTYQMLENERMQVKELKNRGYSPRQLQEMGYSESALHTPALALANKY